MAIIKWLNQIISWFSSQKEVNEIFSEFNRNAKEAFVSDMVPVFLMAEKSRGNKLYKHQFSNFLFHGFRIKILSGFISEDEIDILGTLVTSNKQLSHRLILCGFDTVEIVSVYGTILKDWRLTASLELSI